MIDITVIVPYFNEEKILPKTFELLVNQSHKPKTIIFVNSNSNDNSYNLVNSLIIKYKGNSKILNYNTECKTPAAAKNFGIKKSVGKYIAFMDCDMFFENDWLFKQFNFIKKSNFPIILGQVSLKGKNLIDKISIIHTYGHNILRPCIPSSIIESNFFKTTDNLFEDYNALYDQKWIKKNIKNGNAKINSDISIRYLNIEYAKNLKELYKKVYYYSLPTIKIYGPINKDLLLFFLFIILLYFKPIYLTYLIPIYLFFRNILLVLYKSKTFTIYKFINYRFDLLVLVSIIIDIAKINGMVSGLFKKKINHYQR